MHHKKIRNRQWNFKTQIKMVAHTRAFQEHKTENGEESLTILQTARKTRQGNWKCKQEIINAVGIRMKMDEGEK